MENADLLKLLLAGTLGGAGVYAVPRLASSLSTNAFPSSPKSNTMEITLPRQQLEKISSNPLIDVLGDGAGLLGPVLAVGTSGYAGYKGMSSLYDHLKEKQINDQISQERNKYIASLHASMQPKEAMHKEASEHTHKHYTGCGHTLSCRCRGPKEVVEAEGDCPSCKWEAHKFTKKASVSTPLVDAFCEAIEKSAEFHYDITQHDNPSLVHGVMDGLGSALTSFLRATGMSKPLGASLLAVGGGAAELPFILGARAKAKSETPGYDSLPAHLKLNVV